MKKIIKFLSIIKSKTIKIIFQMCLFNLLKLVTNLRIFIYFIFKAGGWYLNVLFTAD